jgi:hypothetical protein
MLIQHTSHIIYQSPKGVMHALLCTSTMDNSMPDNKDERSLFSTKKYWPGKSHT